MPKSSVRMLRVERGPLLDVLGTQIPANELEGILRNARRGRFYHEMGVFLLQMFLQQAAVPSRSRLSDVK
ncbi:hypothetical protein PG994_006649 [Apiospora phragmitis]|uniref:DUF4158 domain-containing protein n=1 Tax=Apiospora phragmitis TaxID=2905665 RepID=A0ABR1VFN4_9PEZI